MVRVNEDAANDVPIERRHVAYPRPRAHPLVERAVDEKDEVNFEIVDDGPTAAEKLAAHKDALWNEVSIAENKAIDAVVPLGKRRFFNLARVRHPGGRPGQGDCPVCIKLWPSEEDHGRRYDG